MGNCQSGPGATDDGGRSAVIDRELRTHRRELQEEVKILILGAGESGKSTFLKQLKILHGKGFSLEDRQSYVRICHSNVFLGVRCLLFGVNKLGLALLPENEIHSSKFLGSTYFNMEMTPDIVSAVKSLTKDPAMVEAWERRNEFQISDNAKEFFEMIDELAEPNFLPRDEHILRARVQTTGVYETVLDVAGTRMRIVDVGGQRGERRKWVHCFQDTIGVIFLTSLSEYDQTLAEDGKVNRMGESLTLFDELANCRWFLRSSIVLFLNKVDIFKSKLATGNFKSYFPDYNGPNEFTSTTQFIKGLFLNLNKNPDKVIHAHVTCALDTENVRFVFNSIKDDLIHMAAKTYF